MITRIYIAGKQYRPKCEQVGEKLFSSFNLQPLKQLHPCSSLAVKCFVVMSFVNVHLQIYKETALFDFLGHIPSL